MKDINITIERIKNWFVKIKNNITIFIKQNTSFWNNAKVILLGLFAIITSACICNYAYLNTEGFYYIIALGNMIYYFYHILKDIKKNINK